MGKVVVMMMAIARFHFQICVDQLMHGREHGRMEMMIMGMVVNTVVMKMVVVIKVIAYFHFQ